MTLLGGEAVSRNCHHLRPEMLHHDDGMHQFINERDNKKKKKKKKRKRKKKKRVVIILTSSVLSSRETSEQTGHGHITLLLVIEVQQVHEHKL